MEISAVRKRVLETIDRAKRSASERQARADEAARDYEVFLQHVAVPLFRQVANVLRAHGHSFNVFTPGGSVRLMSDRSSEDYIELLLDATGDRPHVVIHASRARGRRVVESERPLNASSPVADLTEDEVLTNVMKELEPLVEK